MQEVSCGEALYGFWHVGDTVCSQLFKTLLFHRPEQRAFSDAMKRGRDHHVAVVKYISESLKAVSVEKTGLF